MDIYYLYKSLNKSKGQRFNVIDKEGKPAVEFRFISKKIIEKNVELVYYVEAFNFIEAKKRFGSRALNVLLLN